MKANASTLPGWPRVLRRELAAAYCGISASTLDAAVSVGRIPRPFAIAGNVRGWLRDDLDRWLDEQRDAANLETNPWDEA